MSILTVNFVTTDSLSALSVAFMSNFQQPSSFTVKLQVKLFPSSAFSVLTIICVSLPSLVANTFTSSIAKASLAVPDSVYSLFVNSSSGTDVVIVGKLKSISISFKSRVCSFPTASVALKDIVCPLPSVRVISWDHSEFGVEIVVQFPEFSLYSNLDKSPLKPEPPLSFHEPFIVNFPSFKSCSVIIVPLSMFFSTKSGFFVSLYTLKTGSELVCPASSIAVIITFVETSEAKSLPAIVHVHFSSLSIFTVPNVFVPSFISTCLNPIASLASPCNVTVPLEFI